MSTESPRRLSKFGGAIVKPQPVSDKSVMESVVDFFQDFTLSSKTPEDKEKVTWVQFEQLLPNDYLALSNPKANIPAAKDRSTSPILLVLGYSNGVQIWLISGNGEAQEVMTKRKGPIRNFKFLISPISTTQSDMFSSKRPLVAMTDNSGTEKPYSVLRVASLKFGDEVYSIPYQQPIVDILCNYRVVVVALVGRIEVLESRNLKPKFNIASCAISSGLNPNPIALASRWMAYADKNFSEVHLTKGGVGGEKAQSYTASFLSAAKSLKEGFSVIGETIVGISGSPSGNRGKVSIPATTNNGAKKIGIVTVVDIMRTTESDFSVHDDWNGDGLVSHFVAHPSEPVTSLTFDPSGMLLLTSDQQGRFFHLFKILVHPQKSNMGAIHHLYILHRGETTAKIQSVTFAWDSRWVAVSSVHGTTHVFPITSYGGRVNKRTHMSKRVVSRASRFYRSAGLEDPFDYVKKSGRDSPAGIAMTTAAGSSTGASSGATATCGSLPMTSQQLSVSPASSPSHISPEYKQLNQSSNPRLEPYPQPTVLNPFAQIRQPCASIPGLDISTPITSSSRYVQKVPMPEYRSVVACFSGSRVVPASTGSPSISREKGSVPDQRPVDSLFIATTSGILTEYILAVRPQTVNDNVTDDSPIEVEAVPKLQWILNRFVHTGEVHLPLSVNNPLLVSFDRSNPHKTSSSGTRSRKTSTRTSESSDVFDPDDIFDEEWLSQVEISTHAPPYRRLWMGPKFTFATFQGENFHNIQLLPLPIIESDRAASSSSSSSSLSKQTTLDDAFDSRFPRTSFSIKSQAKECRTYAEKTESGNYYMRPSRDSPVLRPSSVEDQDAEEQLRASLAEAISDETTPEFIFNQELLDLGDYDESEGSDAWVGWGDGDKGGRGLSLSPARSSDSN